MYAILQPVTPWIQMTSDQRNSLNYMVETLYDNALIEARWKITSWPPSSYSQNRKHWPHLQAQNLPRFNFQCCKLNIGILYFTELNDIRRLSELNSPLAPPIHTPVGNPMTIDTDGPPPDRKRKSVSDSSQSMDE